MARRGRRRKFGPRNRSGDLARTNSESKFDFRALAALQPHRVWLPQEKRLDQKAASPLGCLNLLGVITDAQYRAGLRYAIVVGKYRAVIETPSATAGSGRGYDCPGSAACGRDAVRSQTGVNALVARLKTGVNALTAGPATGVNAPMESCECRRRKQLYDAAFAAVMEAGQVAARAVARVAVHGEPCPQGALAALKRGLEALARHFGWPGQGLGRLAGQ
jgi:hypothetical protein